MSSNREFAFGMAKSVDRLRQLVNNKYLADVVFKVGTPRQLIYAHKNIITIASEEFFTQFNRNGSDSYGINYNENPIVVEDLEPAAFLLILNYIYCDEIELSTGNVVDVYYASQKYLLQELIDRCDSFLQTIYDENDALAILDNNHNRKIPAVNEKCLAIIRDNPLKVFNLDIFCKLNQQTVALISGSRTMNCYKEHVQDAIEQWKKVYPISAKESEIVPKLEALQCSKLDSFSAFQFSTNIDTNLVLTVQKPLHLYGLGIFIGEKEPVSTTEGLLEFNVDIKGVNKISASKTVPLKADLYTCEILFEKVTVTKTGHVKITVNNLTNQQTELFCLREFAPVRTLGAVKLAVETEFAIGNNSNSPTFDFPTVLKKSCIAYLLYNV